MVYFQPLFLTYLQRSPNTVPVSPPGNVPPPGYQPPGYQPPGYDPYYDPNYNNYDPYQVCPL